MASQTEEVTKLTTTKLMAVFFVQLNEAYQISVLLPIVVFMCRDFGISAVYLGVYSSILNASFGFCQFLVSYLWGYLSDIYGRRQIMIFCLVGSCIGSVVFGFSTSFEMATAARCLTGLFFGNLGVVKAYLADITNSKNRAYAFGIIGGSFGIGIVMGSMMGGILIETNDVDVPDDEYIKTTSVLKWWIFEEQYPFLLPTGIAGGIVALNSLIWTYLFIVEERDDFQIVPNGQHQYTQNGTNHNLNDSIGAHSDVSVHSVEMASNLSAPHYSSTNEFNSSNGHYANGEGQGVIALEHVHDGEYLAAHQSLPTFAEFQAMTKKMEPDKMKLLDAQKDAFNNDDDEPYISTASDMFKHTHLGHSLLAYGIAAISHMMFKEMGPVFMAQALLFNSAYIGYTQAYSGAVLFIFVFFIQPWILRRYDNKWLSGVGSALCVIALFCMPSIYFFTRIDANDSQFGFMTDPIWLLIMVFIVEHVLTCAVSPVFVIATCWVNNSVPQYCLGKANGIGQTMAAFVRGFGPLLTGFIWSESYVQIEDGISGAVYYAYLPGALLFMIAIADNIWSIPSYLNLTWEQRKRDQIG